MRVAPPGFGARASARVARVVVDMFKSSGGTYAVRLLPAAEERQNRAICARHEAPPTHPRRTRRAGERSFGADPLLLPSSVNGGRGVRSPPHVGSGERHPVADREWSWCCGDVVHGSGLAAWGTRATLAALHAASVSQEGRPGLLAQIWRSRAPSFCTEDPMGGAPAAGITCAAAHCGQSGVRGRQERCCETDVDERRTWP